MMEAINELSEKEFLDLALIIYCFGYPEHVTAELLTSGRGVAIKQKLKRRIEEWLEI